jgi:hypothetical protein
VKIVFQSVIHVVGNFTIEKEKFRMKENSGNLPKFEKSKEILQKDVDLYILISAKLLVRLHS